MPQAARAGNTKAEQQRLGIEAAIRNARHALSQLEWELKQDAPRVTEALESWSLCKYSLDSAVHKAFTENSGGHKTSLTTEEP